MLSYVKKYLLKTSDETKQPRLLCDWISESHHMGNAWVFSSVSHGIGKCSETHRIGRAWEIGTHTFLKVWVLFIHQISILCCTSLRMGKWRKTHPVGESWVLDTHTLVRLLFFQQFPPHFHGLSQQFLISWENAAKFCL